jgi:hypothetical protein
VSGTGAGARGEVAHAEVHQGAARASVRVPAGTDLPESAERAALARAWLALAEDLAGSATEADVAARRGLDELGEDYLDPDDTSTVDDTGMKVLGADKASEPTQAAALLAGALEARLQMYAWRHEDLGLVFDPPLGAD